jgi:hypothetical protein
MRSWEVGENDGWKKNGGKRRRAGCVLAAGCGLLALLAGSL